MDKKRPTAKVANGGYIQVDITEPPGCLARLEAWLRQAAAVGLWFGLGVMVGMIIEWLN